MRIHSFILAFCLFASTFLDAANIPVPTALSTIPAILEDACEISSPDNYHLVGVGTTWVELAWDFQSNALGGYRVRVYRASDNSLIGTYLRAQNNTGVLIELLTPGETYKCVINSRCENGDDSAITNELGPTTLILELVVSGYEAPNSGANCSITASGYCPLSAPNISPFKICKIEMNQIVESESFAIVQSNINGGYTCEAGSDGPNFSFFCSSGSAPGPEGCNYNNPFVIIKYNGVGAGIVSIVNQDGYKLAASLSQGYRIYGYETGSAPPPGGGGAGGREISSTHLAITSPNPFSNFLDVFLAQPATDKVHIQLFNLSGQVVLERQFEADNQQQFSLPTADLSPGFYLLRIEANGALQTLKVVKSE